MAKIAVIADIHANYTALAAVLSASILEEGVPLLCAGDLVGYGPRPGAVIDRLSELGARCIRGNHDAAVAGDNSILKKLCWQAREVVLWTRKHLNRQQLRFLSSLPLSLKIGSWRCYHGSPRCPLFEYLETSAAVIKALQAEKDAAGLIVGHLHKPLCYRGSCSAELEMVKINYGEPVDYSGKRMVFNPGSVGQPRDGDPRASFAVLDTGEATVTWYRVEYDLQETMDRIRRANLPDSLAVRLASGL
ncbi:MAG: metallophosphoesterase family protein [bacterium]